MPESSSKRNSTGIDFGHGNRIRDVSIQGNVAGRDVHETVMTTAPAAGAPNQQELLDMIARLQEQVAQLDNAPEYDREDAQDELAKAKQAAERGDSDRLLKKLESTRSLLVTLGSSLPAALQLAQEVSKLVHRFSGV
jgi:hypothetical protein